MGLARRLRQGHGVVVGRGEKSQCWRPFLGEPRGQLQEAL